MATCDVFLTLTPEALTDKLCREYYVTLPEDVATPEHQQEAVRLMSRINGYLSFLRVKQLRAHLLKEGLTRDGAPRDEIDTAKMREAVLKCFVDLLSGNYAALSRMCAVHEQAQRELLMTDGPRSRIRKE